MAENYQVITITALTLEDFGVQLAAALNRGFEPFGKLICEGKSYSQIFYKNKMHVTPAGLVQLVGLMQNAIRDMVAAIVSPGSILLTTYSTIVDLRKVLKDVAPTIQFIDPNIFDALFTDDGAPATEIKMPAKIGGKVPVLQGSKLQISEDSYVTVACCVKERVVFYLHDQKRCLDFSNFGTKITLPDRVLDGIIVQTPEGEVVADFKDRDGILMILVAGPNTKEATYCKAFAASYLKK